MLQDPPENEEQFFDDPEQLAAEEATNGYDYQHFFQDMIDDHDD